MEYINKLKLLIKANKKQLLLFGGAVLLVISSIYVLLFSNAARKADNDITPTSVQATPTIKIIDKKTYNPMISNSEIERVEKAQREKYEKLGKKPPSSVKYKFQYELKDKNGFSLPIPIAYSALCNSSTVPVILPVYTLKSHYFANEAKEVAKEFEIDVEPASLLNDDNTSFQYFFVESSKNKYLTLTESSGIYNYHKAITDEEEKNLANIDIDSALGLSLRELEKHKLSESITAPVSSNLGTDKYSFRYSKNYANLKIADSASITSLGLSTTPCNIEQSATMNGIETIYTRKGNLFKLINNTRKINKTYNFTRLSFVESFNEYKDNESLVKIIIGTPPSTTNTVQIDTNNIQLVWYDYGNNFAQVSYIPMYLASGIIPGDNTRVLTLFPAISKKDLDTTDINDLVNSQSTLQLGTFKPNPPKPEVTPPPFEGGDKGGCPGGAIDVLVRCTNTGGDICSESLEVPVDDMPEPYKSTCEVGCQDDSSVITYKSTENPCNLYLKSKGLPESNSGLYNEGTSGSATCSFQTCPC